MKLTKLEIKGFKSFGEKTIIHFDEGVTAVIGPNGCGKSNVIDAIRWVLGEQSTRALRSEKMENILFNGAKSKRASNLAEVSLSFDNSKNILSVDFTEITITRKLYRSGESEYRINDVSCRLKDITDLFLDTGIGHDSYSIIELKMVEEIIADREGSRRLLFEEAAGVSKYKTRKKQTEQKLKETEVDVARVDDLLFEIEKNIKSIEAQARKAEKYVVLKAQHQDFAVRISSIRFNEIRKGLSVLEKNEAEQVAEKMAALAGIDTLNGRRESVKLDMLNKEKVLFADQKNLNDLVAQIMQEEHTATLVKEKIKGLEARKNLLIGQSTEYNHEIRKIQTALAELEGRLIPTQEELEQTKSALPALKAEAEALEADHAKMRKEIAASSESNRKSTDALTAEERNFDRLTHQNDALRAELERHIRDITHYQNEISALNKQIGETQTAIRSETEQLNLSQQSEKDFLAQIHLAQEKLTKLNNDEEAHSKNLYRVGGEVNMLQSLIKNQEDVPSSVKFLKKNADWMKEAPLFSEVISCKAEFRVAIERYLEPVLNYFVVESDHAADHSIALLKGSEQGRASFFVLPPTRETSLEVQNEHSFEHSASELVHAPDVIECLPRYKPLVAQLLDNVYLAQEVTKNLFDETRRRFADVQKTTGVILINFNGTTIRSANVVSGGSIGFLEGKRIGRAKNLEGLEKEYAAIQTQIKDVARVRNEVRDEVSALKSRIEQLGIKEKTSKLSALQTTEHLLASKQQQIARTAGTYTERQKETEEKLKEIDVQSRSMLPVIDQKKQELAELQQRLRASQLEESALDNHRRKVSTDFNQLNIRFHQQQNQLSGIEKDIAYKKNEKEALERRLEIGKTSLSQLDTELESERQRVENIGTRLLSLYNEKAAKEAIVAASEKAFYEVRSYEKSLEEELTAARKTKEGAEVRIGQIKEEENALKLEMGKISERILIEFAVELHSFLEDPELGAADVVGLQVKYEKIKGQIETFGPVNSMAMEALKEMKDRQEFIEAQKNDLLQARSSLMATIDEIDTTAAERFIEAFTQIRENFIEVFRSLFHEEDACDLILKEPQHPLSSDIDIIAKPKGKKPLTINQLSGGEKTLTATAVLFALYLLKPAPFCIFDEVDAPLDDTNIDKFNAIIRKFSDRSQFIIVSHNKKTIASTDVVYGVTMAEPGISEVVPVDLRKFEPAA